MIQQYNLLLPVTEMSYKRFRNWTFHLSVFKDSVRAHKSSSLVLSCTSSSPSPLFSIVALLVSLLLCSYCKWEYTHIDLLSKMKAKPSLLSLVFQRPWCKTRPKHMDGFSVSLIRFSAALLPSLLCLWPPLIDGLLGTCRKAQFTLRTAEPQQHLYWINILRPHVLFDCHYNFESVCSIL